MSAREHHAAALGLRQGPPPQVHRAAPQVHGAPAAGEAAEAAAPPGAQGRLEVFAGAAFEGGRRLNSSRLN